MTFRLLMVAAVIAGAGAANSRAAAAVQCVDGSSPLFAYGRSKAVFLATVLTTGPNRRGHLCADCFENVTTQLRVERVWKGSVRTETEVWSDVPFKVGTQYLIFAVEAPKNGDPLQTSLDCSWSEPYATAVEKRSFLSGRPSRKPQ